MTTKNNNDWREYKIDPNNKLLYPGAERFWQKRIYNLKGEKYMEGSVYIQLVEYDKIEQIPKSYSLDFQISDDISITGKTINVTNFRYEEKNLARAENDALKIIKHLII